MAGDALTHDTINPNRGCVHVRDIGKHRHPQSLSRILIHTVFSTKTRAPFLHDSAFRDEMHAYLGGCANTLGCLPIRITRIEKVTLTDHQKYKHQP